MKYIGENAIKKLISLIKGDLATKQSTITASGLLKGDGAGTVTAADTQEATLVDVPNGLLKGDGTTISAAVAEIDYMAPPTGGTTGQILKKTETGTEWADASVFIATYGTTTSAEIEAAYQAGKAVFCVDTSITPIEFYGLTGIIPATHTAIFAGVRDINVVQDEETGDTNYNIPRFYKVKCVDSSWSKTITKMKVAPTPHASTHASGGSDPITPADIGAATMEEVNSAIQAAIGNAIGGSY